MIWIRTPALLRAFDISKANLRHWIRRGLVAPSGDPGSQGRGNAALWSFQDAVAVAAVARLRACGVPLQRIRRALLPLRKYGGSLASTLLVADPQRDLYAVVSEQQLLSLTRRDEAGQFVCIPLTEISRTVTAEMSLETPRAEPTQRQPESRKAAIG